MLSLYGDLMAATRDRERTRKRILAAAGLLLSRRGFRDVGINAVARQARVDKVLIYRYFGGIRELLAAYAQEGDFWPRAEEILPDPQSLRNLSTGALAAEMLIRFGRALRRRKETLEIMRWELLEQNELTDALAAERERQGVELIRLLTGRADVAHREDFDLVALAAILGAAQSYLLLRVKTASVYNGVELRTEEGRERIERALALIVRRVLRPEP